MTASDMEPSIKTYMSSLIHNLGLYNYEDPVQMHVSTLQPCCKVSLGGREAQKKESLAPREFQQGCGCMSLTATFLMSGHSRES